MADWVSWKGIGATATRKQATTTAIPGTATAIPGTATAIPPTATVKQGTGYRRSSFNCVVKYLPLTLFK